MFRYYSIMKRIAAAAAWGALVIAGSLEPAHAQSAGGAAAPQKNYKPGEYELFDASAKDIAANNFAKALTDLDAWKQKIPESDYRDDRSVLFVQAYAGAKQFDKAVEEAGQLLSKDIDAAFPDPASGPGNVLRVLAAVCTSIQQMQNPTPQQLATAEKAAHMLEKYDRKPAGIQDAQWQSAKGDLQKMAKAALLYVVVVPGASALAKGDCDTAQTSLSKALSDYPDNSYISYQLAQAYMCTVKKSPDKSEEVRPKAIYEFIRTLVIDPTLGGSQKDPKMADMLTNTYVNYHGGPDGLDELKQAVKANPLPPANFMIESSTKVSARKEKEFQEKYPQLAMWLGIKKELAGPGGPQYFEGQLKNAAVPKLKGNVVEGKPACRSKELLVSVPEPDQQNAPAVITLKLDAALTGKPETGEIQWEGVPSAFTPDPFMLTMDTEKAKIDGLKTSACAAAPARPGVKKGVTPKKK